MAKRKTADAFKDTSFNVGYNSEPSAREQEVMPEGIQNPYVQPQPEQTSPMQPSPRMETPESTMTSPVVETFTQPVVGSAMEQTPEKPEEKKERTVRSTVHLIPLHKEMLRIYCFKKNITITAAYQEMFEHFFADDTIIRQEAEENIAKGLVRY